MVSFRCWSTKGGYTHFGHKIWKVSKMCPRCVQNMSKMCPKYVHTHNVSKSCPRGVQVMSKLCPIMYSLSKLYPNPGLFFGHYMDIFWTVLEAWKSSCNMSKMCQKCIQNVSKLLDTFRNNVTKKWTHFGQNLDTFHGEIVGPPFTMRASNS